MKVCIFDEGFIPGLGRGPFRTPIEITEDQFGLYKRMGLKIINATKNISIAETGVFNRVPSTAEEIPIITEESEIKKEIIEEAIENNNTEEIINEKTDEEIDIDSLTKKELINILNENQIECNNNITKSKLKELVENI